MNMLLQGVKNSEFEIHLDDTLRNDWDFLREENPAKRHRFDAVVVILLSATAEISARLRRRMSGSKITEWHRNRRRILPSCSTVSIF